MVGLGSGCNEIDESESRMEMAARNELKGKMKAPFYRYLTLLCPISIRRGDIETGGAFLHMRN